MSVIFCVEEDGSICVVVNGDTYHPDEAFYKAALIHTNHLFAENEKLKYEIDRLKWQMDAEKPLSESRKLDLGLADSIKDLMVEHGWIAESRTRQR